jgi:hypothetical protein
MVFIVNLVWSILAVGGVFVMKDESMPDARKSSTPLDIQDEEEVDAGSERS